MKISADGLAFIQEFESCLRPVKGSPGFFTTYVCPAGVLTIGWGHTNDHGRRFRAGDVWSQRECDMALAVDVEIFEARVTRLLRGAQVTQSQFDALVSWSMNTGGPAASSVWTRARAGDVEGVCRALAQWRLGGGRVLPGLVRRRKGEAALYRGDVAAALRIARDYRVAAANEPMAQAVATAKPLGGSRTMQGSATAGAGGFGLLADQGSELVDQIQQADGHISAGTVFGTVLGAIILAGALYALYARWDDAGRPLPEWLARRLYPPAAADGEGG